MKKDQFYKWLDAHEKEFLQLCIGDKIGYDRAVEIMRKRYPTDRDAEKVFGKEGKLWK